MIKKALLKLKNMAGSRISVDPAKFNDPLALQTEWTPCKPGGTNIKTHVLVAVNPQRMRFKSSVSLKLFSLFFILIGIGSYIPIMLVQIANGSLGFNWHTGFPLLIGTIFAGAGFYMLYRACTPIVFDKRKGYFWKGRTEPDETFDKDNIKTMVQLDRIHALQIISERCSSENRSYYSYELNLVLDDGKRINVVDHGKLKVLRNDAEKLSQFLEKPLWDAT